MAQTVTKIFKNKSGSDLIIFNKIVPDDGSYDVPQRYWADGPADDGLIALISSGDIVVNDGTSDLSIQNAIAWVKRWQLDDASDIVFDPSTSGLTATDMQGVGEELYTIATGRYYQYAESESTSSTTSGSYQRKLRLTTSSIAAGDYLIRWYFEYSVGSNNKEIGYRVQVDDSDTISEINVEPRSSNYEPASGFKKITLSAGVHTVDIDYVDLTNKTTYIRKARLEIRKA